MSALDKEISAILNDRRHELGYSVRKLEELSGVSKSSVHTTLNGDATIQIGILELLCNALGLTDWEVVKEAHERLDSVVDEVAEAELTQDDYDLAALTMTDRMKQQIDSYNSYDPA